MFWVNVLQNMFLKTRICNPLFCVQDILLCLDQGFMCIAILPACAAEGDMMTEAGAMRRTGPLLAPVLTTRAPV